MLRDWWEKAKRIGVVGILIKLVLGLGVTVAGGAAIVVLHFIVWQLVIPGIQFIFYILGHLGQVAHK